MSTTGICRGWGVTELNPQGAAAQEMRGLWRSIEHRLAQTKVGRMPARRRKSEDDSADPILPPHALASPTSATKPGASRTKRYAETDHRLPGRVEFVIDRDNAPDHRSHRSLKHGHVQHLPIAAEPAHEQGRIKVGAMTSLKRSPTVRASALPWTRLSCS